MVNPAFSPSFRAVFSLCRSPLAVKAAMVTIFSCFAFKPSFFMVCASEMVAMLNTEIKMPAKITVSLFDHAVICGSYLELLAQHRLDRAALVHGAIALRHLI